MRKKISLFIVVLCTILCLVGCSTTKTLNKDTNNKQETTENKTETSNNESQETEKKIWSKNYYVDDFDMPTNEWYISNDNGFTGKFSNSATTDSLLSVYMLIDNENISFILYEYGRSQVKNASSQYYDEYNIVMRLEDNTKVNMTGKVYAGGDRVVIDSQYNNTVINALKQNKKVMFNIINSRYTTTTYLFTVESSNFSEIYG